MTPSLGWFLRRTSLSLLGAGLGAGFTHLVCELPGWSGGISLDIVRRVAITLQAVTSMLPSSHAPGERDVFIPTFFPRRELDRFQVWV